jgi:transcriptional regulator with XRE-family HTH domain
MADFPAVVRRFMQARGMSLRGLARAASYDPSYLSKVLSGRKPITPSLTARLDDILGAGGEIRAAAHEHAGRHAAKAAGRSHRTSPSRVAEALQTAACAGTAGLDIAIDSLSELVPHYSHAVSVTTSAAVYDELLTVRSFASSLLGDTGSSRYSDLVVTAGWLSALLAISATDIGDHAAALVWCSDTERRGRDAGHPELAGWAVVTRALIAYYQGQAHRSVTLAGYGQTATQPGTVVHAKLAAQEMRSRAMLGDADGMADARRKAAAAIEALTPGADAVGACSIPLAEDPPYTATSLLLVRRYRDAAEATRRVLDTVYGGSPGDQPAKYARTLLILALAEAGVGHADLASAAGSAALRCVRPAWPTMVLGRRLDHLLAGSFPASADTADYHARYVDAAGVLHRVAPRRSITRGSPHERR